MPLLSIRLSRTRSDRQIDGFLDRWIIYRYLDGHIAAPYLISFAFTFAIFKTPQPFHFHISFNDLFCRSSAHVYEVDVLLHF